MSFTVAIDGHTAAGKGTLAKSLARAFDLAHLDTGLLYRAVGAIVRESGADPVTVAESLRPESLERGDLRNEAVASAASKVAAIPEVRTALLAFQKQFAHQPPDGKRGAVLDGRDIGTVILPQADVKLFITASDEVRAGRRHQELLGRGEKATFAKVLADLRARDARDSGRNSAPTLAAADAQTIDTGPLTADEVFELAKAAVVRAGLQLGPND